MIVSLLTYLCSAIQPTIQIQTDTTALVFRVESNSRLYQIYFGRPFINDSNYQNLPNLQEAYLTSGMEDFFEPAIKVLHNDFNPSLLLTYVNRTQAIKKTQPQHQFTFMMKNILLMSF
jgi:alpha-galactosidase